MRCNTNLPQVQCMIIQKCYATILQKWQPLWLYVTLRFLLSISALQMNWKLIQKQKQTQQKRLCLLVKAIYTWSPEAITTKFQILEDQKKTSEPLIYPDKHFFAKHTLELDFFSSVQSKRERIEKIMTSADIGSTFTRYEIIYKISVRN